MPTHGGMAGRVLSSEPMALVEDGTDCERTLTAFPLHQQGRLPSAPALYDGLFQAVMVHSPYCPFWPSCLSAAHRLSGSSSFSLRGPTFPIVFTNLLSHRHSCDKGIIFLRSYLGAVILQVVFCEQSSFCAKRVFFTPDLPLLPSLHF